MIKGLKMKFSLKFSVATAVAVMAVSPVLADWDTVDKTFNIISKDKYTRLMTDGTKTEEREQEITILVFGKEHYDGFITPINKNGELSYSGNTVNINFNDGYIGNITGGGFVNFVTFNELSTINASKNSVNLLNGNVERLYGGYSDSVASENSVTITNGNVMKQDNATEDPATYSENPAIYGGFSDSDSAIKNSVTINGGNIHVEVFGGYGSTASENSVTINGGNLYWSIYGGKGKTANKKLGNYLRRIS